MWNDEFEYWVRRTGIEVTRAVTGFGPGQILKNKVLLQIVGDQLFWTLDSYGFRLPRYDALDPFSGTGLLMSHTYVHRCERADLWEIHEARAEQAKRLGANITVHCGDSIAAVVAGDPRLRDYNFIILDNNIGGTYGPDRRYCEHFDMMPAIFRYFRRGERAVLIVNYVPDPAKLAEDPRFRQDSLAAHIERRRAFFGGPSGEVRPDAAIARYAEAARAEGWRVAHGAIVPRQPFLNFLVLMLEPL